jgi:Flp pilus assembly pilin Flp
MLKLYVVAQNALARLRDERGQTMAEYGVVLAVITLGIIAALVALSGGIDAALDKVTGVVKTGKEPAA